MVLFVGGVAHFETYGFFVGGVAHFETYGPPPSLMVHHAALVAEGRGFDSPCPAILPPHPPRFNS